MTEIKKSEMQFCKLPAGTKTEDIVAVDRINNWQDDAKEYNGFYILGI